MLGNFLYFARKQSDKIIEDNEEEDYDSIPTSRCID